MPISDTAQVIAIEGPDAIAFAHGQFTSQVTALSDGQWQFSSWLDAQGRVRNLFHLARLHDGKLLAILRGGDAENFINALQRFVFRSRVQLTMLHASMSNGAALPMHIVDEEKNVVRLGCGSHALQLQSDVHADRDDTWRLEQSHAGWPWLPDNALSELLAPSLSLHRLGAIALDKGCYPGQEIVARLHYRGGNKRHLHRIELSQNMANGTLLQRDGREFVRLLDVVLDAERVVALAVITDDAANKIAQHVENTDDDGVAVQLLDSWID